MRIIGLLAFSLILAACGGGGSSDPIDQSTVLPPNASPVANAGQDFSTSLAASGISMDGSESIDMDNDPLAYAWSIETQPVDANASIDNAATAMPLLQTLTPGEYVVVLTVDDGRGGTSTDSVVINLQNDSPIIAIDEVASNLAIGERIVLNATGSSDPNGHSLTYNWSVLSAPTDSNLVSTFSESIPEVQFDANGIFEVLLEVSDGYAAEAELLTFTVSEFSQSKVADNFTYFESDPQCNLMATSEESVVNIIDSDGTTLERFDLTSTVLHLAVSPNGEWIGVAHSDSVSMIRVADNRVFGPWAGPELPSDIIIDNDGNVHIFPSTGQWVRAVSVEPITGDASVGSGIIRHRTVAKMHPNGERAYGADRGLSPSDIERYNFSDGVFSYGYDSPYHGDYPFCGNLWIAENGETILTACGTVVHSTDSQSTDMTFVTSVQLNGQILDASHESLSNRWYVIEQTSNGIELNVYDGAGGQHIETVALPAISDGISDIAYPAYVTTDTDTRTVKIFATDHPTNPQNSAVFKRRFVDRGLLDFPPVTIVNNSVAGFVGDSITLDASTSFDPEGSSVQFEWSIDSQPEGSGIALSDSNLSMVQFNPEVAGEYTFSLVTSDGERAAQPETVSARIVERGNGLQMRLLGAPSDIVYNKVNNQVIYTLSDVAELRIRDLNDSSEQVVPLSSPGERVDVSPNGNFAVVAHAGLASLINLNEERANLMDTQQFSADWGDIVIDDEAIAYLIPRRDQWVDLYAIDFANNIVRSRFGARAGTQVRMHPIGSRVYAADRGLSPSDIERWDVTDIDNITSRDSIYHGDYLMGGNIWINESGSRLIVAGGHVFRSSEDPNIDMRYVESLPLGIRPLWADHSNEAGRWVIVSANQISFVTDSTYQPAGELDIEPLFIDPDNLEPSIDKVFFSEGGDKTIVIVHSDGVSQDNYVIQILDTPQ